ncbi:MAG: hypothetical protein ACXWEY_16165 [Bacteroidia bacterium]
MKSRRYTEKRKLKRESKKQEKIYNYIFVALAIIWIAYYICFEPETIGDDYRYNLYIFWLPTIAGILALGFYKHELLNEAIKERKIISKFIAVLFLFLMSAFWSYLSIGQLSKIIFHTINKEVAKTENTETHRLDINQIAKSRGRGTTKYKIRIKFQDKTEEVNISYEKFKQYENENPKDYLIKVKLQKGIWNYYLLNDWDIVRK